MRIIIYKTSYTRTYIYVPVPGTILSSHANTTGFPLRPPQKYFFLQVFF